VAPTRIPKRIPTANDFPSLVMVPPLVNDCADLISYISFRQTLPTQSMVFA
jgi:hypothetical protein